MKAAPSRSRTPGSGTHSFRFTYVLVVPPKKKTTSKTDAALDVMAAVNLMFPGAMTLGNDPDLVVTRTPSEIVPIDLGALDGGLPRGRFIEAYGPYSTMKSYFAYKAIASYQRRGLKAALIDTEHSWDPEWGEQLGIDTKNLYVARPETAEQAVTIIQAFITQRYDLFVFDSIAAAQPKQHAEVMPGEDTQPGALARVMSKGLARLTAVNKHTTGIFINQTRNKIGVSFGSPITTSGGNAMGFYASYRLSFVRIGKIQEPYKKWDGEKYIDAKRVTGHKIQCTLEKSKLSAPHTDVVFTYDLRTGEVDTVGWLIGQGLERGHIQRTSTGHHTIPGVLDKAIHGADKFRQWVDENPEVSAWLMEELTPTSSDDSGKPG